MAAEALFRLSASQADESNIHNNTPACAAAEIHAVAENNAEEDVEPLTIQTFLAAQEKDANCHLLAKIFDALDSEYF